MVSAQSRLDLQAAPSRNRISENASRCMMQDRKGYLWIGTIDGLNRYDGYGFRIYRPDPLDSTSISSGYISDILEDSTGDIWVATFNGLNLYRRECDCFLTFSETETGDRYIMGKLFTDLMEDDSGRLWVSYYGGMSYWDRAEQRFVMVNFDGDTTNGLQEWDVTGLGKSRKGGIWIGYQDLGLSYYQDGQFTHYFADSLLQGYLPLDISNILERPDGQLWIGGREGIFLFDPASRKLERKFTGRCTGLAEIEPGKLWAGISFDRVYEWQEQENAFRPLSVYYDGELVKGDLIVYFMDETGTIWATHKGLAKQDVYEKRFRHFTSEKGNPNSLSDPLVAGIELDAQGNPIVACNFGGVNYFDRQTGRWRNHRNDPLYDNEIKNRRLMQGHALDGNWFWLLSGGQIYQFHLKTGQLTWPNLNVQEPVEWQTMLKDQQTERVIWLVGNGQIFRHDPVRQSPKRYWLPIATDIKRLHQTEQGRLFAASDSAVFLYQPAMDSFLLHHVFKASSGFDHRLQCLAEDEQGRLWIGRQSGLVRVDPLSREEKCYTTNDGLPNNNINAILLDDNGRLWLSTNYGLSRFDPETETFRNFNKHDGLQDEIFLPLSAEKAPDGTMYFGGVNGFNVFHPDSLPCDNPYPPRILISDLKIFNQSVRAGENSVLRQHISDTRSIRLDYRQTSISFELTALGYSQPENNQYAYMIEGVDPDWNHVGTRHTATYTGLPRGETLLFKAKAANHDGVWTEEPVVLEIYINPPFWEKTSSKLLFLFLLLGGGITLYQLRVYNIKRQNRRLEREVKKQTAEIEQQAAHLRSANMELKDQAATIKNQLQQLNQLYETQSRFFTSLSHEFRTPLTLLLGNLEELVSSEHPRQALEQFSRRMQLSAQQLLLLVNQLMDTAKLESGQYGLRVGPGDFSGEIQTMIAPFQPVMAQKGVRLVFSEVGTPAPECWFDRDVLHKVLNNLLSNALKYTTQGGRVEVAVRFQPTGPGKGLEEWIAGWGRHHPVQVTVKDTGQGIPQAQLPFIFDRFYQVEDPMSARTKGTGIGLSLVKQLLGLHKGHIQVTSEEGRGTAFHFFLPLARRSYTTEEQIQAVNFQFSPLPEALPPEWYVSEKTFRKRRAGNGQKDAPMVLIVEDNTQVRALIIRQLADHYRIMEAEDGQGGWQLAIRHLPDLIISDVIMPLMNGFDFCKKLKTDARTSHIPVILLTALSAQQKKLQGLQTGADAYLSKPFSREELLLRIENLLKHRERLRQQFLKEFSPDNLPEGVNKTDQEFLEKLTALVEENLDNTELNIDAFTRELAVSRSQLFRKLKALTGMSATEFIRDYRLKRAYQLLQQQDLNISQIIYATGFNSRSYFYQCFRKKFGVSPSELLPQQGS